MNHNECNSYLSHLRSEHRRLEILSRGVREDFERARDDSWYRHDRPQIAARLGALRDEFLKHVDEEEQGGCVDEAVSRLPSLSGAARQVHQESEQLVRRLDSLLEVLETGTRESAWQAYRDFAEHLRLHERHEELLVEKGLNTFPFHHE